MGSKWEPLPGYEGVYWIDSTGRVRNARGKILAQGNSSAGPTVELRNNGQRERFLVEQLKLTVFGGYDGDNKKACP